jgi:hypothetical protein
MSDILLFPEKEARSVGLLGRRPWATQTSAEPPLGGWGLSQEKDYYNVIN